jgi:hypothetical protein
MPAKRLVAFCVAVLVATAAGGVSDARKSFEPKAGGYTGKVTNANGKGAVRLAVATFVPRPGAKPRKGPQLFEWTGILRCDDDSRRDVGPAVFAPLRGVRFSGKSKSGPQITTLKGRFTSATKLRATARVVMKGRTPATRCDTGPVRFKAHRR